DRPPDRLPRPAENRRSLYLPLEPAAARRFPAGLHAAVSDPLERPAAGAATRDVRLLDGRSRGGEACDRRLAPRDPAGYHHGARADRRLASGRTRLHAGGPGGCPPGPLLAATREPPAADPSRGPGAGSRRHR